jgi:hypothetical protein
MGSIGTRKFGTFWYNSKIGKSWDSVGYFGTRWVILDALLLVDLLNSKGI